MLNIHRLIVAFGVVGVVAGGCSGPRLSAVGESCATTNDCATPNVCILQVCQAKGTEPPRLSAIGESCQVSSDCVTAAVCIDYTCRSPSLGITPNTSECAIVECSAPTDCCPTPPSDCAELNTECAADPGSIECTTYQSDCVCTGSDYACTNGKCVAQIPCKTSADCVTVGTTASTCSGGLCVECAVDSDCTSATVPQTCQQNKCVNGCKVDGDCPVFSVCTSGACVVQGCSDNDECVVADSTSQATASCGSDHTCHLTCSDDFDCQSDSSGAITPVRLADGNYSYHVCVSGSCQIAGCKTNVECHALLESTLEAELSLGLHANAVCQQ